MFAQTLAQRLAQDDDDAGGADATAGQGASPEQIDVLSGNINYTIPIL